VQRGQQRLEGPGRQRQGGLFLFVSWKALRPSAWNTRSASSLNSTASPSKAMRTSFGWASLARADSG
jgi:hypothetical protein